MQRRSKFSQGHAITPSHGRQLLPSLAEVLAPILTPLIGGGGSTVTQSVVHTVSVPVPTIGNSPPPSDGGAPQNGGGGGTGQAPPQGSGGGQSSPAPGGGGQPSNGSSGQESPPNSPLAGAAPGGVTPSATEGGAVPTSAAGITANGNPTNSADSVALPTAGNANNLISSEGYHSEASPSDTGSGNNPGDSTGQADSPQDTNGASEQHSLTSGAKAGIVLSVLLASVLVVLLILRRRANSRRSARRKWWFINGRFEKPRDEPRTEKHPGVRVVSVRSSFGTSFDHALDLDNMEFFEDAPPLPSLAASAMPNEPLRVSVPPTAHLPGETSHRNSAGSVKSDEGQTLSIPQALADQGPGLVSPSISVRPFTPSESFAFLKPPPGDSDPEVPQRIYSPESNLSSNRGSSTTKHSSLSPTTPTGSRNLFVGPQVVLEERSDGYLWTQFGNAETIQRPFHPTLDDELLVVPGDAVRIVKPYDDGWALVEQMNSDGKRPQGHIPIDCLTNAGQEVPAYLASRRISSQTIRLGSGIPNAAATFGMAM